MGMDGSKSVDRAHVGNPRRGIKGGKWFGLINKVWKWENLQSAIRRVAQNKGAAGVDGQRAEQYLRESPRRLEQVQDILRKGQYKAQPVQRVWIPKLGRKDLRPLGVPAVKDRVLQPAVRNVTEPIFENIFAEHRCPKRTRRVWREGRGGFVKITV